MRGVTTNLSDLFPTTGAAIIAQNKLGMAAAWRTVDHGKVTASITRGRSPSTDLGKRNHEARRNLRHNLIYLYCLVVAKTGLLHGGVWPWRACEHGV